MLSVVIWKWGKLYSATDVNRLAWMLQQKLRLSHELVCFTDDPVGIAATTRCEALPNEHPFRALRRAAILDPQLERLVGKRFVQLDLDCVIREDITPLLDRPDKVVCWRRPLGHYNPSMLLMDTGALGSIWEACKDDLYAYLQEANANGWPMNPSDESVLNYGLFGSRDGVLDREPVASWTAADGIRRCDYSDTQRRHHRVHWKSGKIVFFVAARNKRYLKKAYAELFPEFCDRSGGV